MKLQERKYLRGGDVPREFTPMTLDNVIVGEEMGPVEYSIKPSTHQRHCDTMGMHMPWFEKELYLFPWEMWSPIRVISQWKYGRMNQQTAASSCREYFKLAKVGQKLYGEGLMLEKYQRRGKDYLIYQNITRDETGDIVQRCRQGTVLLAQHKGKLEFSTVVKAKGNEGPWKGKPETQEVPRARRDMPLGYQLPNHLTSPMPMRISGFQEGGWSKEKWQDNVHEDNWAQSVGYAGGVAEGSIAWEFALLPTILKFFGEKAFFLTGKFEAKYCGPPYLRDVLVGKARVIGKILESPGVRVILETRTEKADGTLVNVGMASAIVT